MKKHLYLATLEGLEKLTYNFTCPTCQKETILLTGYGRYGNIGPFDCPHCNKAFYATIDDNNPKPTLYVNYLGEQPSSLLAGNLTPLLSLKPIIQTK